MSPARRPRANATIPDATQWASSAPHVTQFVGEHRLEFVA
jgi:hypothetical protein